MAPVPRKPPKKGVLPAPSARTAYTDIYNQAQTQRVAAKGAPPLVYTQEQKDFNKAAGYLVNTNPGLPYKKAQDWVRSQAATQPQQLPATPQRTVTSGGGGGRGGGGTAKVDTHPQEQLDYLLSYLASKNWNAPPETGVRDAINARQGGVTSAYGNDLGTLTGAYDKLDAWLNANQRNPFADIQFQQARVAPDQNVYLQSQGVQGLNNPATNPDDSYGGFKNAGALLSAGQQQSNQSQLAGSQMARADSTVGIGAQRNAYMDAIQQQLAAVAGDEYKNQQGLEAEKRQVMLQLAALIGQGAKTPADMSAYGIGSAPVDPSDPYNWKQIRAALDAQGQ